MNGVDAVVATGNDFRAVEAGIHAYASQKWKILESFSCQNRKWYFYFGSKSFSIRNCWWSDFTSSIGEIISRNAGKTIHKELMQFVAVAGLAQNFAALRSLTTTGIKKDT
jgi:hydroxymethylglutaryl-CoA reductase